MCRPQRKGGNTFSWKLRSRDKGSCNKYLDPWTFARCTFKSYLRVERWSSDISYVVTRVYAYASRERTTKRGGEDARNEIFSVLEDERTRVTEEMLMTDRYHSHSLGCSQQVLCKDVIYLQCPTVRTTRKVAQSVYHGWWSDSSLRDR